MVTMVGLQGDFINALQELIELDYDAVAAYETAIDRISLSGYKNALQDFKKDHERHIKVFSTYLKLRGAECPDKPGMKSLLTQGKVVLANLVGDMTILRAMRSNEVDTNTAYERLNNYEEIPADIKEELAKGRADERRHAAWLDRILEIEK